MVPHASSQPRSTTSTEVRDRRRIRASRVYFGAAIAVGVSAFLPWTQETITAAGISETITNKLSDTGVVFLLLSAAGFAWVGFLANQARAGRGLLIGAWVASVWMVGFVLSLFAAVSKVTQSTNSSFVSDSVTAGIGLLPALIGAVAGVVATILLQRSRVRSATVAPPLPTVPRSADGRWWWDGNAWLATATEPPPLHVPVRLLSADGRWSWDGNTWLAIAAVAPPLETARSGDYRVP